MFNLIDFIVFLTVLLCGFFGAKRGFLQLLLTSLGWFASATALVRRYAILEEQLVWITDNPAYLSWIASTLVALAVLWIAYFLSAAISHGANRLGFGEADTILGFLLCSVVGMVVCLSILLPLVGDYTSVGFYPVWNNSKAAAVSQEIMPEFEPNWLKEWKLKTRSQRNFTFPQWSAIDGINIVQKKAMEQPQHKVEPSPSDNQDAPSEMLLSVRDNDPNEEVQAKPEAPQEENPFDFEQDDRETEAALPLRPRSGKNAAL